MDLHHILYFIWSNRNIIKYPLIHRGNLEIWPFNALFAEIPIFLFWALYKLNKATNRVLFLFVELLVLLIKKQPNMNGMLKNGNQ